MFRQRYRSASIHEPQYPKVPFDEQLLKSLLYNAKGTLMSYGLVLRTAEHPEESDVCSTLPVSLLPSIFPRHIYQQAIDVQPAMNKLQFLVSLDRQFLNEHLGTVAKGDEMTQRFLNIYNQVMDEGLAQTVFAQVQRSDYMCHQNTDGSYSLKQIEVNSGCTGGLSYAQTLSQTHLTTLRQLGMDEQAIHVHMPENNSFTATFNALTASWRAYGNAQAICLMLYETDDPVSGEFWLMHRLFRERVGTTIRMEKLSLSKDRHRMHMDEKSRKLYVDGSQEVGVVYFQGAACEEDFKCEMDWQLRLHIEQSTAVKIPFIGTLLADRKKIQQVLSEAGMLERFFPDQPETVNAVRATYCGQWSLDNTTSRNSAETEKIMKRALLEPIKFVLKSQKEGGTGTNYFGESVAVRLAEMDPVERATYVLMERLWPMVHQNYLVRPLQPVSFMDCTSELGVFGYLIGDAKTGKIWDNRATGHLMKTKPESVHEAGICNSGGVMDTAFLVD